MISRKAVSIWVIIPAAGVGSRVGAGLPKQYLVVKAHTLLWHTIQALRQHPRLSSIMVAISADDAYWEQSDVAALDNIYTSVGGASRAESVLNGLVALSGHVGSNDWVLVHDACRPFVTLDELNRLIETCESDEIGGLLALPSTDTLKRVQDGRAVETIDREVVWRAQTPQMFRYGALKEALVHALEVSASITDEASAMELAGHTPCIVEGRASNIKITYPDDLRFLVEEE